MVGSRDLRRHLGPRRLTIFPPLVCLLIEYPLRYNVYLTKCDSVIFSQSKIVRLSDVIADEDASKDIVRKAAQAVKSLSDTEFSVTFNPDVFQPQVKHVDPKVGNSDTQSTSMVNIKYRPIPPPVNQKDIVSVATDVAIFLGEINERAENEETGVKGHCML